MRWKHEPKLNKRETEKAIKTVESANIDTTEAVMLTGVSLEEAQTLIGDLTARILELEAQMAALTPAQKG